MRRTTRIWRTERRDSTTHMTTHRRTGNRMLKKTWKGCPMDRWITGSVVRGEKEPDFLGLRREQQSSLTSLGTTGLHSDATTNWRLRHCRGRSYRLVKREARPFLRDRRWDLGCAGAYWRQGPAGCEDTVLAVGVRRVPDEQVRRRQRRESRHRMHGRRVNTPFGEKVLHMPPSQREETIKLGTAIPSWYIRWHAELVVKCSSRHLVPQTSDEFPSRRDGMRTDYSECGQFRGLQMERIRPSNRNGEARGGGAPFYLRSADGGEGVGLSPACRYLRTGQERTASLQRVMEEDRSLAKRRPVRIRPIGRRPERDQSRPG